jgi:hypothetical protein
MILNIFYLRQHFIFIQLIIICDLNNFLPVNRTYLIFIEMEKICLLKVSNIQPITASTDDMVSFILFNLIY